MNTQNLPTWDMQKIKDRMITNYGWDETVTNSTIEQYRKFMFLVKNKASDRISPPVDVDEVWHEHILFTRDYSRDIKNYVGHFVHHVPNDSKNPKKYEYEKYGLMYSKYFEGDDWKMMFATKNHNPREAYDECEPSYCDTKCHNDD